ncbi:unnamed protein product, partial [Callosobruchus maculatus]
FLNFPEPVAFTVLGFRGAAFDDRLQALRAACRIQRKQKKSSISLSLHIHRSGVLSLIK